MFREAVVMLCHSEKLRIFLVEDTSFLQQAVKYMLENFGCTVSVAASFTEVLKEFDLSFDGVTSHTN